MATSVGEAGVSPSQLVDVLDNLLGNLHVVLRFVLGEELLGLIKAEIDVFVGVNGVVAKLGTTHGADKVGVVGSKESDGLKAWEVSIGDHVLHSTKDFGDAGFVLVVVRVVELVPEEDQLLALVIVHEKVH